jgi:hypothetical protein
MLFSLFLRLFFMVSQGLTHCLFFLLCLPYSSPFFFALLPLGREIKPLPHQAPYISSGMCSRSLFTLTAKTEGSCADDAETISIVNENMCMAAEVFTGGLNSSNPQISSGVPASGHLPDWLKENIVPLPKGCVRIDPDLSESAKNDAWKDYEAFNFVADSEKEHNILFVNSDYDACLFGFGTVGAGYWAMVIFGFLLSGPCCLLLGLVLVSDEDDDEKKIAACGVCSCTIGFLTMAILGLALGFDTGTVGAGYWAMVIFGFLLGVPCCLLLGYILMSEDEFDKEENETKIAICCVSFCIIGFLTMAILGLALGFACTQSTADCSETNTCLCLTAEPCINMNGTVSNKKDCLCTSTANTSTTADGGQYCSSATGFYCHSSNWSCTPGPTCEKICSSGDSSCVASTKGMFV